MKLSISNQSKIESFKNTIISKVEQKKLQRIKSLLHFLITSHIKATMIKNINLNKT